MEIFYQSLDLFFGGGEPEEYLLFKADAQINEVWVVAWNFGTVIDTGYARCIYDDSLYVFGVKRRVKGTLIFDASYYYNFFWLAEGIGLIRNQYDDGSGLDINYTKVNGVEYGGLFSVDDEISHVLSEFILYQNYPNPFNPITKISWQSPVGGWQTLKVYDILGREISTLVNENRPAGNYVIEFNISNLPSGVYFYKLQTGDFVETKKMLLLK
jgi:hypothetical protein